MNGAAPESGRDAYTREILQSLAHGLNEVLPQNWGFFLVTFPFEGERGRYNYVSNARRQDIIEAMRELVIKFTADKSGGHAMEDYEI